MAPTLFTDVNRNMRIANEEIFGPVAAIMPFDSEEEAVDIANSSIYGLAAGIWTSNVTRAHRVARNVESGIVWVNCYDHGDMTQPWGGFKQSGQGATSASKPFLLTRRASPFGSIWSETALLEEVGA